MCAADGWMIVEDGATSQPNRSDGGSRAIAPPSGAPATMAHSAAEAVPMLAEHVLLPLAGPIAEADARLAGPARAAVADAVARVPEAWLGADPAARRADFTAFLDARLAASGAFVEEVERGR